MNRDPKSRVCYSWKAHVKVKDCGKGDSGGASRFFYCAKPGKNERNAGLKGLKVRRFGKGLGFTGNPLQYESNFHPTVKPLKLMRYLITMITPPGGTCLDPFAGSGTTCVAAKQAGFRFIGIEREREYVQIALARVRVAQESCP